MRWLIVILLLFAVVIFGMIARLPSQDHLDQLARSGAIEGNAPVKTHVTITINAPPEKVWGLLSDLKDWPKWQPDISDVELSGPVQSGSSFSWNTRGSEIHSKIAVAQPQERLVWTGTAYGAKAIHAWTLERLPDGRTLVQTDESKNGFLLSLFYSSKKLKESDQRWLDDLKVAAER